MSCLFSRFVTRLATLSAALLLAACGGGGDDTAPDSGAVALDSARTARATVGPAGGSVSATAADGRRYTLTVPAGSLAASTEISATPVTSMGDAPLAAGTRAAVRFGPAGLTFSIPATLRIEGVDTALAEGRRLVGFVRSDDGARMERVPAGAIDGALEVPVPHFSDVGVADATPAELALVPLTTPDSVTQEIWREVDRRLDAVPGRLTITDVAAALNAAIDGIVTPLQAAAADSTEPEVREAAVSAFGDVARVIELGVASENVPQLLALMNGRVERVRAAAGALLTADFEAGLAGCAAPGPADLIHMRGLNQAASVAALLPSYDLSPERVGLGLQAPTLVPSLGLDTQTLRRRLNDCARVVFVPQARPSFEAGRPVSLDQQAALAFAIDSRDEVPASFDFLVLGTDGDVATPSGFGDSLGRYTTVVTPRSAQSQFGTRACYVAQLRTGALVPSEICGTQTLGGTSDILVGRVDLSLTDVHPGFVDLRVRVEPGGTNFTVVSALGSATLSDSILNQTCSGPSGPITVGLRSFSEAAITDGLYLDNGVSPPGLRLLGRQVLLREFLVEPCSVRTEQIITERAVVGFLLITGIERDAEGRVQSITVQASGNRAPVRLVPQ